MTVSNAVDAFVAYQNRNRGLVGEQVASDYNALTAAVPAGGNSVTGISGIATGAATMALGGGYNGVVLDGSHTIQGSASGPDNYAFSVDASGNITVLDENTGRSQLVTGVNYLVFNNGAQNSDGSYQSIVFVESGVNAQVASLYNAALGRQPDLPGLEYYAVRLASGQESLHQVATQFIASPEFQHRFAAAAQPADNGGPNDQAFIAALYQNILHRTPAASEVTYYVQDLQGTLPGIAQQDRAQLLINFSVSPENQADISGWLVNSSNGAYADVGMGAPGSQAAATVLNVQSGGTVNTALIDPSSFNVTFSTNTSTSGTFNGFTINASIQRIGSYTNNVTIYCSTEFPNADVSLVSGNTVYGAPGGNSTIGFSNLGGIVHLFGTGNLVGDGPNSFSASPPAIAPVQAIIYGFGGGDIFAFDRGYLTTSPTMLIVPTPASGAMIQGASYIASASNSINFGTANIMIDVGTVADASAASMAAAAAKVYVPLTATQAQTNGFLEGLAFYGQTPSGDTSIWLWQSDSTHSLTTGSMRQGMDLIGVPASSITTANMHI